ncbi:FAD-dependent monooxygenase [Cryptosporangium aurantiacum]|uniref:2-octaprenyl-3-methyl-6-methoxy-1,4-benzoquinol hydroxylase n=1 Tax=Cryptosporangium aurantiacum TaxID=134849 RepID=A0A1M7KY53_9ACTN|nr:FAD-dependent monooxygenase [Cryptosporangium aurantiacum]SHM70322.1 2-octaprenyl-3-methyl-6-methoxy-1,4-benzoquinol hydroxylase [Cryptosporangium aurantiacum]
MGIRIAVVGGGIGGLTTARALNTVGLPCVVLERAGVPRETGYGIQLGPDGARLLPNLGVHLDGTAVRPVTRELRRWSDNTLLSRETLPAPYFTLPRSELHRLLSADVPVRHGTPCAGVTETPDGVTLELADGGTLTADLVIGADGLHSVVRAAVGADEVRCSGSSAFRAVVRRDAPPRVVVWLGPGQHCVAYPIAPGLLNVVATVGVPGGPRPLPADPLPAYHDWHPDVRQLLAAGRTPSAHGLFDRPPLARWHTRRIVLVGDAAHPMLPYRAQGASLAIEDATTLAACLASGPLEDATDLARALARYDALRRPRVAAVADAVRAAARDHDLPDGPDQQNRDRRLAEEPAAVPINPAPPPEAAPPPGAAPRVGADR